MVLGLGHGCYRKCKSQVEHNSNTTVSSRRQKPGDWQGKSHSPTSFSTRSPKSLGSKRKKCTLRMRIEYHHGSAAQNFVTIFSLFSCQKELTSKKSLWWDRDESGVFKPCSRNGKRDDVDFLWTGGMTRLAMRIAWFLCRWLFATCMWAGGLISRSKHIAAFDLKLVWWQNTTCKRLPHMCNSAHPSTLISGENHLLRMLWSGGVPISRRLKSSRWKALFHDGKFTLTWILVHCNVFWPRLERHDMEWMNTTENTCTCLLSVEQELFLSTVVEQIEDWLIYEYFKKGNEETMIIEVFLLRHW